jgi:hypothetical protein
MDEQPAKPRRAARKKSASTSEPSPRPVVNKVTVDDEGGALQTHIAERLVTLRSQFQEAIGTYSVRVQGMLSQCGDLLSEDVTRLSGPDRKRRDRALRRILVALDALDLKPAKGRRRDLKAIETFTTKLSGEVAEW